MANRLSVITFLLVLVSCVSHQEKEARQRFLEYLSVVDSSYQTLHQVWKCDTLPDSVLKQKVEKWIVQVSQMEDLARKASEIIAPYDAQLRTDVESFRGYANESVYYAKTYLQGNHDGYYDKFSIWLSHAGVALQDAKAWANQTRWRKQQKHR